MKKTSLISLLPQILLSHKEWFESKGESGIFADLSEENLREANFSGCVLVEANLQAADLSGAIFTDADLRGANLLEAQLKNTQLQNANFEETDLMWPIYKERTWKTPGSMVLTCKGQTSKILVSPRHKSNAPI